ncbi:hypothetical protein MICAI_1210014 [Microcystis sp. T1-4]|nr:hypothetical protein MICAI_1210014 [Microcystis sp. T1-4]
MEQYFGQPKEQHMLQIIWFVTIEAKTVYSLLGYLHEPIFL